MKFLALALAVAVAAAAAVHAQSDGVPLLPPLRSSPGSDLAGAPVRGSSVAAPVPGTFLGCYRDAPARVLDGFGTRFAGMTPLACIAECRSRGFPFAGTQGGSECFCGHTYDRLGAADNCNVACDGDSGQACGGALANSVYATGSGRADIPSQSRMFAAPAASALAPGIYDGVDIQGPVLRSFPLSHPRVEICAQACLGESGCAAFSFVRAGGYAVGDPPTCYLKSRIDATSQNLRVTSGVLK